MSFICSANFHYQINFKEVTIDSNFIFVVFLLLVKPDSLFMLISYTQALAVYGQVTGRPKDGSPPPPPSAGLPDSTTKDPELSEDQTKKGSDGETKKEKPSASLPSDFREVEGSSKDIHMRWNPPVSSRSHFTAAASPTRARDFS